MANLNNSFHQVHKAFADQADLNHNNAFQLNAIKIRPRRVADLDHVDALLPSLNSIRQSSQSTSVPPLDPKILPPVLASSSSYPYEDEQPLLDRMDALLELTEQDFQEVLDAKSDETLPRLSAEERAWFTKRQQKFILSVEAKRREAHRDVAICKKFNTYDPANDPDPKELEWEEGEFEKVMDDFYGEDVYMPEEPMDMNQSDLGSVDMIMSSSSNSSSAGLELQSPMVVSQDLPLEAATLPQYGNMQDGNSISNPHEAPIDLDGFTIPRQLTPITEDNWQRLCINSSPLARMLASNSPPSPIEPFHYSTGYIHAPLAAAEPYEFHGLVQGETQKYLAFDEDGQLVLMDDEPEAEYLAKRFPGCHVVNTPTSLPPRTTVTPELSLGHQIGGNNAAPWYPATVNPAEEATKSQEPRLNAPEALDEARRAATGTVDFPRFKNITSNDMQDANRSKHVAAPSDDPYHGNPISSPGPRTRRLTSNNESSTEALLQSTRAEIGGMGAPSVDDATSTRMPDAPRIEHVTSPPVNPFYGNSVSAPSPFTRRLASSRNNESRPSTPVVGIQEGSMPILLEHELYIGDMIIDTRTNEEVPASTRFFSSSPAHFMTPNSHNAPTPLSQRQDMSSPPTPTPQSLPGHPPNAPFMNLTSRRMLSGFQAKSVQNVFAAVGHPVQSRGRPLKNATGKKGEEDVSKPTSETKRVRAKPNALDTEVIDIGDTVTVVIESGQTRNKDDGETAASEPARKKLKWKFGGPGGGGRYIERDPNEPDETPVKKPRKSRAKATIAGGGGVGNAPSLGSTATETKERASGRKRTKDMDEAVGDNAEVPGATAEKKKRTNKKGTTRATTETTLAKDEQPSAYTKNDDAELLASTIEPKKKRASRARKPKTAPHVDEMPVDEPSRRPPARKTRNVASLLSKAALDADEGKDQDDEEM